MVFDLLIKSITASSLDQSHDFIPCLLSLSIFCEFLDTTKILFFLFSNFLINAYAQ